MNKDPEDFRVRLPLDGNYLRRRCMQCSREFKIFFTEDVGKMVNEMFEEGVSEDKEIITRENTLADKMYCCPYCGKRSQQSLMFTEEQWEYLNSRTRYVYEKYYRDMFHAHVKNMEAKRKRPQILPPLNYTMPPETNDMQEYSSPCCNDRIKVKLSGSDNVLFCFRCGSKHPLKKS
mgnify:CR=1 FL=1